VTQRETRGCLRFNRFYFQALLDGRKGWTLRNRPYPPGVYRALCSGRRTPYLVEVLDVQPVHVGLIDEQVAASVGARSLRELLRFLRRTYPGREVFYLHKLRLLREG